MSWHFCYFTFMPGSWTGYITKQDVRGGQVKQFLISLCAAFSQQNLSRTWLVSEPVINSLSLSSKFTLKGLTCGFPAAPASVNMMDVKKSTGSLAQLWSQNVWFSLATSHRPGPGRWSPSFNFPQYKPLLLLASSQHRPACGGSLTPSPGQHLVTSCSSPEPWRVASCLPSDCKLTGLGKPVNFSAIQWAATTPSTRPDSHLRSLVLEYLLVLTGLSLLKSTPLTLGYQKDFSYFVIIQNFLPCSVEPGSQPASQV